MSAGEISDWACNYCGWNVVGSRAFLIGPPDEASRAELVLLCSSCCAELRNRILTTEPDSVVASRESRAESSEAS